MEGIAGMYGYEDRALAKRMLSKLGHRGPSGPVIHSDDGVVLGAVARTTRPNSSRDALAGDDGVAVASDSYIFNKQQLAEAFAPEIGPSLSDQELMLAMYSELGPEMFGYIDGAFAVAIVDGRKVILARDRYGLKPLYLSGGIRRGVFSSEMKSQIVADDEFAPFPPGKVMVRDKGLKVIRPGDRYSATAVGRRPSIEALRKALLESTAQALDGGDGFNILLSGGVDSSAIAAAASLVTDDLRTVCVSFDGSVDAGMARKVADALGTEHTEKPYDIDGMLAILDDVVYAAETFDYPLVRSCIPNYMATHEFNDASRITLCGEGGDEVFAGYDYMRDIKGEEALGRERRKLLKGGHLTGFQRVDRMTASASLDGRMPIMSRSVVRIGLGMSRRAVLGSDMSESKLALRKTFAHMLPDEVVWRRKMRFSDGAGSITALVDFAEEAVSDEEFARERKALPRNRIRTKEELLYYRAFAKHFDSESAVKAVGFTPRP